MKRLISLIVICALLLTLSSCGQTDSQTSEQSASDSSVVQAEPGENFRIRGGQGYFFLKVILLSSPLNKRRILA